MTVVASETCAQRDPKGLWKRAASGGLPHLTGAGGAWEDPLESDLIVRTDKTSPDEAYNLVRQRFRLVEKGR